MNKQKYFVAIFIGAMFLTANAGFINAIVLLGIFHNAVSYMTGNLAEIGLGIETHNVFEIITPLAIVFSFIIGAIITGMIINTSHFCINQKYARTLIILAMILALSTLLMDSTHPVTLTISECLAAMACGMQNAMTTTFSGAIVRTTHMTGILTDLGIQLGRLFKNEQTEVWKIKLFAALSLSFIVGSVIGLILFAYFKTNTMWFSVMICLIGAKSYYIWRRVRSKQELET